MEAAKADAKIGLLATVSPQGLPHVTLITSLQALSPRRLMWGQFCEGSSKQHVKRDPHAAFLVMSRKRELWRGRCLWSGQATEGPEYEFYNRKPLFRYNSYFGIHAVHYLDLVETTEKEALSLAALAASMLAVYASWPLAAAGADEIAGNWTRRLLSSAGTLKFLSFVDAQGFPRIVPGLAVAARGGGLVFRARCYQRELRAIPTGAPVAVYAINPRMESVLVRGWLRGYRRLWGPQVGVVDLNWVYNSMPPLAGQVYPPQPLAAVSSF